MTDTTEATTTAAELLAEQRRALAGVRTPSSRAYRRLTAHKLAVAGGLYILLVSVMAALAPLVTPSNFADQDLVNQYHAPSGDFWLGADFLGRDIYSRLVYGARISLAVAALSQVAQFAIGVPLGLLAGYYGGRVDAIVMRAVDFVFAMPALLLVLVLANFFRVYLEGQGGFLGTLDLVNEWSGGLAGVLIAITVTWWIVPARLVRGLTLSVKESDYVTAARALGASDARIVLRHILPNTFAPLIVTATLLVPVAIILEAGVSFLGLGVQPPLPSWGLMLANGVDVIRSFPFVMISPAVAVVLTTLAFNFLGDGLRDALDPTMRGMNYQ